MGVLRFALVGCGRIAKRHAELLGTGQIAHAQLAAVCDVVRAKAERIGERALAWSQAAISEREVRAYRLLQGMVALTRSHPRERVDWACGVALGARAFRYRTLRRLVEQAAGRDPQPPPRLTQAHELIRSLDEYAQLVAHRGGVA